MRYRLLVLPLLAGAAIAQDTTLAERFLRQEQAAFLHYNRKEWTHAIAAFEQQIAIFSRNPRPYYNIACCYALQGDAERAATWLSLAITQGWRDAEHLEKDPDFAPIRSNEAFRACLAQLARARRQDPDPLPQPMPPEATASASSVRVILAESGLRESLLRSREDLLMEHQYRRELFQLYDRRMGRLARYLVENGDAADADEAAEERVRTAMAYLVRATGDGEADRRLREVAARYVLLGAEEFVRSYPCSPRLANVQYWRAHALARLRRPEPAERVLRTLLADHGEAAPQARAELCALLADHGTREDLRREYAALRKQWGERPPPGSIRFQLAKARLLAEGIPADVLQALRVPAPGGDAPLLLAFVSIHSVDSELRLGRVRERARAGAVRAVVVCADTPERAPDADVERWLEAHASGLAAIERGMDSFQELWLFEVPTLLLVRNDGEVLAFDPTDAELGTLTDSSGD